ncbi:MAG TPA: class I SAM-dependent methyltransferase [Terriglobales bacterium]|nr:class I SAM-dependent methyltransferase [Terriglobales bacterium]
MGFYSKHILPHVIDLAMRNKETARVRAEWVPKASGDVLEIGVGSGLNLPLYTSDVRRVYAVEPSRELQLMARKRSAGRALKVEFISQSADEALPIPDESIDTVLMTWTLCSIPNPSKALGQMRRVLRPSGRLLFIEHGRSPDAVVARWQNRLTPIWKRIGGGCHLNRKVDELIANSGFRFVELTNFYLPGPRPMTYTYQGIACH